MSLDVTIAGTSIPTNAAALKGLQHALKLVFSLDKTLASLLDTEIGSVPSNACRTSISYTSPAASWNPGGGPVQFGLQGGTTGGLEVVASGDLVSYTDGLDSPQPKSIKAAHSLAYMKLTLKFTIFATAAGNYSAGAYGVKAALDTSDTYAVTFCKAIAPSTPVRAAIAQTFESFVLPLHKDTLNQMSDGDFLLHDFDGNLHLSFGAYAGLDRVLYSGRSSMEVLQTFGSPLATLSGAAAPEINVGVALDFSFQYTTRFEALLSKLGETARLHLFRPQNAATSTVLKATLTFDANTSASISTHTDVLSNSLVKVAGSASSPGGAALAQVLSSTNASSEIDKYVAEVNDKLTGLLNRANGIQANLQVAIESNRSRTILAGYDFDLTSPQFPAAWLFAIAGDFVRSFQTGAVTLDPGSGLEQLYQQKTTFSCHLFNLWSLTTWNDFSSNVSLVYAGNNVFHFVAKVGRTTETDSMGTMHSMNIYFSASADVAVAGHISNADIDLHIDLTAQNDSKAVNMIAAMLSAIEGGPVCDSLARGMHAFATNSKTGRAQLQVTIPARAYAHINCDPYTGDKPQSNSNRNDAQNWAAFAQAADDLNAWPLRSMPMVSDQNLAYLKTFVAWEKLNMAATGVNTSNRVNLGEPFTSSGWPEDFPEVDDSSRQFIVYSMIAGQSFMNFCAALGDLVRNNDINSAGTTWNSLLQLITDAIKQDLNVDFLRPAALATIRLCKSPVSIVGGPSGAAAPLDHFAVSIGL